jgi:hypothetical protein
MTVNLNLHFKVFNLTKTSFQTFFAADFSGANIQISAAFIRKANTERLNLGKTRCLEGCQLNIS